MHELSRLVRPQQSQVRVDPTPKSCPSDGFNYPSFRLINRQARIALSAIPFHPNPLNTYRLFATANSNGWFAAARNDPTPVVIFSQLHELRSALRTAQDGDQGIFIPQRIISVSSIPNIIVFAFNETRLIICLEMGDILVFDTSRLFSLGSGDVKPLHTMHTESSVPVQQIHPNPSSDPNLADLIAVLHADGKVQVLDSELRLRCGWTGEDLDSTAVAVSWSPKGKQIAIGLRGGDILTFTLASHSFPQKHIPATATAVLVSLNWLGPGHTFRTSYAPLDPNACDPIHHIVSLDAKSSSLSYSNLSHPYRLPDRSVQSAFTLLLPKWDQDRDDPMGNTKSLLVVGDACSTDLEVIGNIGNSWYQQSQENPLTIPLDEHLDDTTLLALEIDLTDDTSSTDASAAPIMYAYLNDGTVQGWYLDHPKPYTGMIHPLAPIQHPAPGPSSTLPTELSMDVSSLPTSSQPSTWEPSSTSAFGHQLQPASQFGQSPRFDQPSQSTVSFGQVSPRPVFGQPSGFGQQQFSESDTNHQVSLSLQTNRFGSTSLINKPTTSTFGSAERVVSAFGSVGRANASSQSSLGSGEYSSAGPVAKPEASSSDSSSAFGNLSLGRDADSDTRLKSIFGGGIFGLPSPTSLPLPPGHIANRPSPAFGSSADGVIKPATGFGTFEKYQPAQSKVSIEGGVGSAGQATTESEHSSMLGAKSSTAPSSQSSFGQPGFATKSVFGQPVFGQSVFGNPNMLGTSTQLPVPNTGAFGAFASSGPTTFGSALHRARGIQTGGDTKPAWSGDSGNSAFSKKSEQTKNVVVFDGGGAGSPFGGSGSMFGNAATSSVPGAPIQATLSVPAAGTQDSSLNPVVAAGSPSSVTHSDSFPAPRTSLNSTTTATSAFGNLKTSNSGFKPASGFGAFGSHTMPSSSPFFKINAEAQPRTASAFGNAPLPSTPKVAASVPTFGTPSVIGSAKSAFAPTVSPSPNPTPVISATGGFSAFTGSSTALNAFVGTPKSFGDLLRAGDVDTKDPVKPRSPAFNSATSQSASLVKPSLAGPGEKLDGEPSGLVSVFESISGTKINSPASALQKENVILADPEISAHGTPAPSASKQRGSEHESKPPTPAFPPPPSKDVTPTPESAPVKQHEGKESNLRDQEEKTRYGKDQMLSASSSAEPSYGSLSLSSQASSSVEVSDQDDDDGAENFPDGHAKGDVDLDDVFEDDNQSSLTDSLGSETSDDVSDDESGIDRIGSSVEAFNVPLPQSRSSSTTPQAEVRSPQATPSPPASDVSDQSKPSALATIPEESTTPPGSPKKEAVSPRSLILAETPSVSAASPLSFGLGIGRPTTRPARSSPLASAPMSGDGNDEDETANAKPEPALRLHPASPKPRFGVLTQLKAGPLEEEGPSKKPARPKTPPLSSFGTKLTATPTTSDVVISTPVLSKAPNTPPSTPLNLNLPGAIPKTSVMAASFGDKTATPLSTQVLSPSSSPNFPIFTTPAPPALVNRSSTPSTFLSSKLPAPTTPTVLPNSNPSPFAPNALASSPVPLPSRSLLGGSTMLSLLKTSVPLLPVPALPPPPSLEEGMQAECAYLFESFSRELEDLRLLAQEANRKRVEFTKSAGGSCQKNDLSNSAIWGLSDAIQFGQTMKQLEEDIVLLKEQRNRQKQLLQELQSKLLKARTRKEEIVRFNEAKTDTEFAIMLKARTLGPEHLEIQTQLQRKIRGIRDRIQKLENHLQASKRKLSQINSRKPGLRAPSLDTINRTYRNIDLAIQQQVEVVANLMSRLAKLNVTAASLMRSTFRDPRLPDPVSKRPFNVTPHVAVTTAAALNAERSAQRLKRALLAVRKEPLLNAQAILVPSAPVAFSPEQKINTVAAVPKGLDLNNSSPRSLFGSSSFTLPSTQETHISNWVFPEDNFSPSPPSSGRRGAGAGMRRHGSVPLPPKKSPGQVAPAPAFDWGPLPNFNTKPPPTMTVEPMTMSREKL